MRRFAATLALLLAIGGSGTVALPARAPAADASTAKPFARPGLDEEATRLVRSLAQDYAGQMKGHTAADLFAAGLKAKPDSDDALAGFAAAIAAGRDDAVAWMNFALASEGVSSALPTTDSRRDQVAGWVWPAAYRAYERATTRRDEAAALKLAGASLARREKWRPALDAERASLAAVDDPALRTAYDKLREAHGFHYEDYKVDADASSPRICFTFSEELAGGGPDLARFVALDGSATAAVSADGRQLCVEGLAHGQRYKVTIRRGLPSTVGETLLVNVDDEIFVPDRAPRVSFVGNAYVLPRVGADGIPLVSVNVDKADVRVLRIGDRNVVSAIRSGDFRDQVAGYRFSEMADSTASPVWSGTLDTAGALNGETRTAFPVRDALGPLKPGVYVMRAKPHREGVKDDDDDSTGATQWFVVSDLGLTTLSGGGGGITALVRSLASAKPLTGVAVKLVAKDNEVLDTRTTGADGAVRFDPGLSRGHGGDAPALLVATTADGDYDILDLGASPFDLTDRGDKGRPATQGLDALVFAERGVYRSGETVHLTALLRDGQGTAATGLPLTLVVSRPDGVESRRVVLPDAGLGGHTLPLPLLSDAASGTWRVEAYADPKGQPVGETSFLVEDYLPERLSFDLTPKAPRLKPGAAAEVAASVRFLYGAPGRGLEISGDSVVDAASGPAWPALDGYTTGLTDERIEAVTTALPEPVTTGDDGRATVSIPVPAVTATRPLEAKIRLSAVEPGGRAIERSVTVPILPATALIGVKSTSTRGDGETATFGIVTVDMEGARSAVPGLRWRISRLGRDYQWYEQDGRWRFERVSSTRLVADGTLATSATAVAAISAPLRYGRYRLDLSTDDPGLPPTSLEFDVGFTGDEAANAAPDLLDVTLDRADYRAGETLHATMTSRFAGHATLVIGEGAAQFRRDLDVAIGDNAIDIPVDPRWGTGAYAMALAHRPLDVAAKRMPGRALGLAWFSIDAGSRDIGVKLDLPALARPRSTLRVPVKLTGLPPGEAAAVEVSAVDVGILNLTRYETPKPIPFFFGQRTLGTEVRDLYGALIDGLGVPGGAIRSGGDGGGELSAEKPTQAPLARYSGIVPVEADGTATVAFDIPAFNGTVRVAAVAWSKGRTGSAEADVVLRDPVVVVASLPRFLGLGDRARARFDIDDVEGPAGAYRLEVEPRGPWFLPADALDQTVELTPGKRTGIDVPVTAAGLGTAGLSVRLTGPGGLDVSQDVALAIAPGAPAVYRRDVHPLAPGQSLTVSRALLAEFVPGSGSASIAVSPLGDIDVPALLLALDRYPVGCSEQIVSRALPLLYVDKLAPARDLANDLAKDLVLDGDLPDRIRGAIAQLLSRQTAEGSFGLWSASSGTDDAWLDSYVADFLTRARERGYAVPPGAMDRALDRLRNVVANGAASKGGDVLPLGYAAYVLARNGRPVIGDLRYLAGSRLDAITTPLGKAQIGAALALLGDRQRAAPVFAAATAALSAEPDARDYREDYGSKLRDAAAVLALAAEAGLDDASATAGGILSAAQRSRYPTNTQEQAWLVLAAQAVERQAAGMALDIDGTRHAGPLYRSFPASRLDDAAVVLTNAGRGPVDAVVTTSGQLPTLEPAAAQGYTLERRYYRLDGEETDPAHVRQNERLVVVLKVTEASAVRARLLLTDPLPAGFEIDNPALVQDGAVPDLPGLDTKVAPSHTEFRDDRFTAAYDRSPDDPASFSMAYVVRAVTPGRFVHPPAVVEDMYRPERFGRTGNGVVEVRAAE